VSLETVALVRRANELMTAGDAEAALELFHPEAEWRDLGHAPDTPETVQGREAIGALWQQWVEVFEDLRAEIYDYVDADPWVICDTHWWGTGKGSELLIDIRQADAYEVRDGAIVRAVLAYADTAAALEAVGAAK
jgi:ketosteroid isomerase-like protein